ncbi:hypothetical protein GF312_19630 [Candidatus Poribacteria bacterium]|nr:hypothetical protein [Candidatus Poribacteria bacterium]
MKLVLAILILLFLPCISFSSSLVNVPLDHWSYNFIARLQAKGLLTEYLRSSVPYSRGEMADMAYSLSNFYKDGRIKLNPLELELLEEMKNEFTFELTRKYPEYSTKEGNKHILDWVDEDRYITASLALSQQASLVGNDKSYLSKLEVLTYGNISNNLSFYNHSEASYEAIKELPLWKLDGNDPRYKRYPWSALSNSYVVLGNSKINLLVGKDEIRWGPGYHGTIGLSGVNPAFDSIKIRTKLWKFNFTSLLGFLRDDLTKKYRSDLPSKYLAAHRVDIMIHPGITLAWQEAYIFTEKLHIELVNPFMPYQMAEDYLGEIGNNTMEGDIEITLIPNVELYASLFLDDFHTDKNPFKYTGFGWAGLAGFFWTDPFSLDNTNLIMEYARVEPWTYTHKGTRQAPPIPTSYKHFDVPLGHWMGPNADDLYINAGWWINKNLSTNFIYNRIRRGEEGSNINISPLYSSYYDGTKKEFLGGIVEETNSIGLTLEYRVFERFNLNLGYKYTKINNRQKEEVDLPENDKNKLEWKEGWNTNENEFYLSLRFVY